MKTNYSVYREAYDEFDEKIFLDNVYAVRNKFKARPYVLFGPPPGQGAYDPKARLSFNRYGLRTPYVSSKKGPGAFRICVLGGSLVWGAYAVRNDITICALLEQYLNEGHTGKQRFEVVNCGIGGYVSTQELIFLELSLLRQYKPDMVIFLDGFNDFISAFHNKIAGCPVAWKMCSEVLNAHIRRQYFQLLFSKLKRRLAGGLSGPRPENKTGVFIEAAENYYYIHLLAQKLLDGMNIKFISMLQPALGYSNKTLTAFEQKVSAAYLRSHSPHYYDFLKAYYDRVRSVFGQNASMIQWHDLASVFDDRDDTIFIDCVHPGDKGIKVIAGKMKEIILKGAGHEERQVVFKKEK